MPSTREPVKLVHLRPGTVAHATAANIIKRLYSNPGGTLKPISGRASRSGSQSGTARTKSASCPKASGT